MPYQPTIYRTTQAKRRVMQVFLDQPPGTRLYGYELGQLVNLRSGSLYPMLRRLADAGWLACEYEDPDQKRTGGRPARVYYRLTKQGRQEAQRIAPPPPIETLLESV